MYRKHLRAFLLCTAGIADVWRLENGGGKSIARQATLLCA